MLCVCQKFLQLCSLRKISVKTEAIYWGYLNLRAEKLGLPFNDPEARIKPVEVFKMPWLDN